MIIKNFICNEINNKESDKLKEITVLLNNKSSEAFIRRIIESTEKKLNSDNLRRMVFGILTKREIEVFEMSCKGMTAKEIAGKLFIAKRTVDNHRYNIRKKLGIKRDDDFSGMLLGKGLMNENKLEN